jgi:hypothetical protein
MNRLGLLLVFSFALFSETSLSGRTTLSSEPCLATSFRQDTTDIQMLINGKVWRNLYSRIRGDQFLFSNAFLPGTITANSRTWNNRDIRYDIYTDELDIIAEKGMIVQINKELVSAFTINYDNKIYRFIKLDKDSLNNIEGYVNVLYRGTVSLFIKYTKKILPLAVDHKYDAFDQIERIFMMKDGKMHQIRNKHNIIQLFGNYKKQIKNYVRSNKLRVSKKIPESFIPLAEFCDKL